MICCNLKGGLGNQLFQIAAGFSYALDFNLEFRLNTGLLDKWHCIQGESPKVYFDNIFSNIDVTNHIPSNTYNEPSFTYQKIPNGLNEYIFDGYFQSEKYFKHNSESILSLFNFEKFKDLVDEYDCRDACSIAVRRGDYLNHRHIYNVLDMSYYNKAMEIANCNKYIIYSDDMDWCKNNFIGDQFIFADSISRNAPAIIYLTSICKHNIIANSTLSWWGAWLNQNDHKKVIVPKLWFTTKNMSSVDLVPTDWINL